MKKTTKILLLSMLTATMATAVVAGATVNFAPVDAAVETDVKRFAMVDGASIRLAAPKGLRFIAEMGEDVYNDLMMKETGVDKKMGMIIVPYDYLNDSSKYSDGVVGNYQNLNPIIDSVFYDSTNAEESMIYEKDGYYRVNGVISNLYLQNYDRDFVGIAYIAETENGKTTYRFTQINEENNVRSSVYVAAEAYKDYTDEGVRDIFDEYVMGAHLDSIGVTETVTMENGVRNVTYSYGGQTFTSMDAVTQATQAELSMSISTPFMRVAKDGTATLTAAITDRGAPVNVSTNIVWASSDTSVVTVDQNGELTYVHEGEAQITATFMGMSASCYVVTGNASLSFESGIVPGFMKEAHNAGALQIANTVATDGGSALAIPVTGGAPSLKVTTEFLAQMFADPSVDYIAFDAKTAITETSNFRRYTMRTSGALGNECYEADQFGYNCGIRTYWKTFYFSRADYNAWVQYGIEAAGNNYFIIPGGFSAGDTLYIDNLRVATKNDLYDFEGGGLRTGTTIYYYTPNYISNWSLAITGGVITSSQMTANASSGRRALEFTKTAGKWSLYIPKQRMMLEDITATGYVAIDVYVPENSDVTFAVAGWNNKYATNALKKGAWNTIYTKPGTAETLITAEDTTGGTYAIDNIRSITKAEYTAKVLDFELSGGGLRTDGLPGVFYYYGGDDHVANTFTIAVSNSGGTTQVSNARLDMENTYSGDYSLAFEKTTGYLTMTLKADSAFGYPTLKNGFVMWIYSTVALNGKSANNFINGWNNKFGEDGVIIPANEWTKLIVEAEDINASGRFLIMQGSTAGTIYIDGIRMISEDDYKVEEPEVPETPEEPKDELSYKTVKNEDGSMVLAASTHSGNTLLLPSTAADVADMSYVKMGGNYGFNDYLVFDFTGNNMPIMSFFNTEVKQTIFNQEENADVKGWVVANGFTYPNGAIAGGIEGAHANRVVVIGPYKISYKYDDNGTDRPVTQFRTSEGSASQPSPIGIASLLGSTDSYRVIAGWVESGELMNMRLYVFNLTTGATVVDYTIKNAPKATWDGDIALYGSFGRTTTIDKLYAVEENVTNFNTLIEKYRPTQYVASYNATWNDDGSVTFAAATHNGGENTVPTSTSYVVDMPYIAFKGNYGLNDFVVFDFTGDNFPFLSFFTGKITKSIFNIANDATDTGWIVSNGIKTKAGSAYPNLTHANSSRIQFTGSKKISCRYDDNAESDQWRASRGSAASPSPISMQALQNVTDRYRAIIGFVDNGGNGAKSVIYVINMVTGAVVLNDVCGLPYAWEEGSIVLYSQFGTATVLDQLFPIEENTTLDALKAKYAKDIDYSDEAAVTLERYAYSGPSNGQWYIDGNKQVADDQLVDYRTVEQLTTYKEAGFNVWLAQDSISVSASTWNQPGGGKELMDRAYSAGLKVILTDSRIQTLSEPVEIKSNATSGTPWVVKTHTSAIATYAATYGMEPTQKYANSGSLDSEIAGYLALYKDHPAFYGVMLGDEPSYHNAYCYGEVYKSLKRVMPEIYVQYNLLPMEQNLSTIKYRYPGVASLSKVTDAQVETAYKSYLGMFLDSMATDYIQYDDYPFKSAEEGILFWKETVPYIDNTSLRNLQIVAQIAKERGLSVKVVTQSCMMRTSGSDGPVHIRKITEDDARWLNNYLVGFGVKQINYFTYWTKASNSSSGEWFVDGASFVNRDGTTTEIYDIMKAIMADNTKFAQTVSHFNYNASKVVTASYKFSDDHIVWGDITSDSFQWLKTATTSTDATLITELYDHEKNNYMYMLMNTIDPYEKNGNKKDTTQTITATFDSRVTKLYVYDQYGNRTQVSGNVYTATLTAGQAVYVIPCFN